MVSTAVEFLPRDESPTTFVSVSMLKSACPEKQLLVHCARSHLRPVDEEAIRALVPLTLDWEYLLSEATENSVVPLLHKSLRQAAAQLVPAVILDRLGEMNRANTIRCLFLSAELTRILQLFQSESIRGVPYKGPVLACQAYGDVTLREFEDLDIVLPQKDLPRAHALLERQGYTARFPWILSRDAASTLVPGEYNYRDKTRHVMVELHTELTLRHFPRPPDLEFLAQSLFPVDVAGQEILTYSPEITLVLLCLHGSKDFWERLSWIADISEMLLSHPDLDWEEVYRQADLSQSVRILHLGLNLAVEIFGTVLPPSIRERVAGDSLAAELTQSVSIRILGRDLAHLHSLNRFQFRRRLVPGFLSGIRYSSRLTFVPTEDDWEMISLPRFLSPLYLFLRPFRLLRKYGVRTASPNAAPSSHGSPKG